MNQKFLFILSFFLLLTACDSEESKDYHQALKENPYQKCGYFGDRKCSAEERSYINDIQFLISKIGDIANNPSEDLNNHFYCYEKGRGKKRVHFLGECHTDLINQIENYAYIEKNIKSENSYMLHEGPDSMEEINPGSLRTLARLRCAMEYERHGHDYIPEQRSKFCQRRSNLAFTTEHAINYNVLKISRIKHYGWDDQNSDDSDWVLFNRKRNSALVSTVKSLPSDAQVFIWAGNRHSPLGEYVDLKARFNDSNKGYLGDIYQKYPSHVKTEEIYNELGNETIFLTHKKLWHKYYEKYLPYRTKT